MAITKIIPNSADLDNVSIIAKIHNIVIKKFICFLGDLMKSFKSCILPPKNSITSGKKAIKKYP
jgi:hypothetical protein